MKRSLNSSRPSTIAGPKTPMVRLPGQMYALTGNTEGAVEILDELRAASKHAYVPPVAFAVVYAGLGKIDDAFHWLEKAVEQRDGFLST